MLTLGHSGDAVRLLQESLEILNDGVFGPQTEAALKEFQKDHGLLVSGIVDEATLHQLDMLWLPKYTAGKPVKGMLHLDPELETTEVHSVLEEHAEKILKLNLSRNEGLRVLSLPYLPNLTHLDLSHSCLSQLPDDFGINLPKLEFLSLCNNFLSYLPLQLTQLTELTELHLSGNAFHFHSDTDLQTRLQIEQLFHHLQRMDRTEVWYLSYGSNLLRQRLNCYLTGGRAPGASKGVPGARRPYNRPAGEAKVYRFSHSLKFSRHSGTWDGPVAFLSSTPASKKDNQQRPNKEKKLKEKKNKKGVKSLNEEQSDKQAPAARPTRTIGRMYRLKWVQFVDVVAQENALSVRELGWDSLYEKFTQPGFHDALSGWYGRLVSLGPEPDSGLPVLTFTAPDEAQLPRKSPSRAYVRVIAKGLVECGLTPKEITEYFISIEGFDVAPDLLTEWLTDL